MANHLSNASGDGESRNQNGRKPLLGQALTLQLHCSFDVGAPGFGLMSTPPE
jgi:hypothetical protein